MNFKPANDATPGEATNAITFSVSSGGWTGYSGVFLGASGPDLSKCRIKAILPYRHTSFEDAVSESQLRIDRRMAPARPPLYLIMHIHTSHLVAGGDRVLHGGVLESVQHHHAAGSVALIAARAWLRVFQGINEWLLRLARVSCVVVCVHVRGWRLRCYILREIAEKEKKGKSDARDLDWFVLLPAPSKTPIACQAQCIGWSSSSLQGRSPSSHSPRGCRRRNECAAATYCRSRPPQPLLSTACPATPAAPWFVRHAGVTWMG